MREIRAVVNQCGVALELHRDGSNPVNVDFFGWPEMEAYRADLAKSNPDMRHATIGQLAVGFARRIFTGFETVSEYAWTYNASENTYQRG